MDKSFIHSIAPSRGAKYSPNLCKWLKSRRVFVLPLIKVYRRLDVSPDHHPTRALYVGYICDGMLNGARMIEVTCKGSKAQSLCYGSIEGRFEEVIGFWERYLAIGRCAIDEAHDMRFIGDETRWEFSEDGKARSCQWCGDCEQEQVEERKTIVMKKWVGLVKNEAEKEASKKLPAFSFIFGHGRV